MPRRMLGDVSGAHAGLHTETPMCKYEGCTPNDPNAVCDQGMTSRPRRMIPHPTYEGGDFHSEEHDEAVGCSLDPPCIGVQTAEAEVAPPKPYDPPPKHYDGGDIDPWAVWDAFGLDKDAYLANAVKYLLRAGKKDIAPRLDDLIKARNYINKAIEKEGG